MVQKKALIRMPDSLYREGLVSVLKEAGLLVEVLELSEIQDSCNADYLILEFGGKNSPCDLVLRCVEKVKTVSIVLLAGPNSVNFSELHKLKSFGVNAILSKDIKPSEIVRSLVLLPEHWVLNLGMVEDKRANIANLTDREWEILALLAEGTKVKEIARALNLCVKTVESHKFNLMTKIGVHSIVHLVHWYSANKNS